MGHGQGYHAMALRGMIEQADCLDYLPTLEAGSVDLVYADPPFNSGRDYAGKAGQFSDRFDSTEHYLDFMRPRLAEMWRVCGGSLYLHCDDTAAHRLRCLLDEVCGEAAYLNTVTWKRSGPRGRVTRTFSRIADQIIVYARPKATFNPERGQCSGKYLKEFRYDDNDGRGKYRWLNVSAPAPPGYRYEWNGYPTPANGYVCPRETLDEWRADGLLVLRENDDGTLDTSKPIRRKFYLTEVKGSEIGNIWTDIRRLTPWQLENSGYPTQKPVALLKRIIAASSNPDDLVLDPFCGSGTTLLAAKRLGRRFIGCDVSADAVALAKERLDE